MGGIVKQPFELGLLHLSLSLSSARCDLQTMAHRFVALEDGL